MSARGTFTTSERAYELRSMARDALAWGESILARDLEAAADALERVVDLRKDFIAAVRRRA